MATLTRAKLLGTGIAAVGAFAVPGVARAAGPTEADLATYRLALGTELLGIEFYSRAAKSSLFPRHRRRDFAEALSNEKQHLAAVSSLLSAAGQTVPTADDFDIAFPGRAFTSRLRIAQLGIELETAFLGAYLNAAGSLTDPAAAALVARLAASQSRHLGLHWTIADERPVGPSFPVPLDEEQVSAVLDKYLT